MSRFRILSNTGWILLGSTFHKISSIVLLYILSRYLGADGFGKFSFIFFYIMLFGCITEMGLTPILIKHVNSDTNKSDKIMGKGIIIGLAFTILAILLAWSGTYALHYETNIRYLILMASVSFFISFRDVTFRWILEVPFRAKLNMGYPVLLGVVSETLGLILILLAVYKHSSMMTIVAAYVLSNLPSFLVLLLLSIRAVKPSFTPGNITAIDIIREAFPIGISNIMTMIYLMLGSLILFQLKSASEVGYYALAFRLITSLRIIPEAMMHSLFPFLAKAHLEEPLRIRNIFETAMRYGAFLAFPIAIGTMVVAPSLVVLMGGSDFKPAATALSILIWATFLSFFNIILRFTFNAISLQRYNMWVAMSMVFVSVISAFLLIPRYGFIGASYTLVFAEGIGFVSSVVITHHLGLTFPLKYMWKYLIVSIGMAVGIWFLPYLLLQILVGTIIYVAMNLIIGGFEKDEILKLIPGRAS